MRQGTFLFLSDSRGLPSLVGLLLQPVQPLLILVVLRTLVELLQSPGDTSSAASAASASAATAASAAAAIASNAGAGDRSSTMLPPQGVGASAAGDRSSTAVGASAAAAAPPPVAGFAEDGKAARLFAEDYPSDEEAEGSNNSKRTDELTYWCEVDGERGGG